MTKLKEMNVALVGCGRMGSALVQGAVGAQALDPRRLWCSDLEQPKASQLAMKLGAHLGEPPEDRTLWIIAVKPHHVAATVTALSVRHNDVIISVAAGTPRHRIEEAMSGDAAVVRAMPNTPALVGAGMTAVLADTAEPRSLADELFGAVGDVVHIADESLFDAVTAVSGSGPAYVFVAIEAIADGGVAMGLSREIALKLAVQTVLGAATLAKSAGAHPAELKDQVASPGGTTIAGLTALEQAGFRSALIDAVRAATERGKELGESD